VALVKNQRSEGTCSLHNPDGIIFLRSVLRLLVKANVVLSSQILVTLMMEEIRSSEILVPTRATRRHNPENGIFQL
jgi:hypothetical protein